MIWRPKRLCQKIMFSERRKRVFLGRRKNEKRRTRGKRLLELLGLLGVLEDESVEVAVAADLELGLAGRRALLDAGSC